MATDRDRPRRHPAVPNTFSVFLLLLFPLLARPVLGDLAVPDNASGILRPGPMILPLALSYHQSSRHTAADGRMIHWRRQLQRAGVREAAEARMRLYDDLLTNGYYTTRLYIGTPPQEFALIVDSGSTLTYVPCSTCEHCGNHQDPRFQPDLSTSYKPLKCSTSADCMCDREKDQCIYERQYAEMSSSSGVLGEDVVSFGNESALKPQTAIFGCENIETGDLFSQHADGIIGLGRGHLSIMDQLVGKGVITDSFSLCYGGMDVGGGAMVLGDLPFPSEMVFSHSDPVRSPYYNVELREIHVAGEKLQLNPRIFDKKHGTILDSGTTYIYLPQTAFIAFRDAVMRQVKHLKEIHGPDPSYKDICFSGAGSDVSQLSESFPEVDLSFSNGQKLSLSPENYLFRHSKVPGAYCLGVFQNSRDPTTLLGGILVRNTLVTYDRENARIGFWKTNCSELWDRLNFHGTPSPASSSPLVPSTPPENSLPPISSARPPLEPSQTPPSDHQDQNLPVEFHVGLITFELYLSLNYSELEPHIPELRDIIAHNMVVNASQVQVISSQSEGNGSLIRWAIFPSESGEFLSHAAAMDIISRLTNHHVHLPENFGSYQLRKWKIEPLPKRSWLQKHGVPMALAVAAVVLLCFSTFLVWYFRVHRQGPGSYKPVNAAVPEHELQPL